MTLVDTRERMLALAPVPEAVHRWGGRIFIQIGNAGIYAMEGWNSSYAKDAHAPARRRVEAAGARPARAHRHAASR